MCLQVAWSGYDEDPKPVVLTEDLKVYKLLSGSVEKGLMSPYRAMRYQIGGDYSAKLGIYFYSYKDAVDITTGLHTFLDKNEAVKFATWRASAEDAYLIGGDRDYVLVECTIPVGSEVFFGSWAYLDDNNRHVEMKSAASNRLIVNKVID